MLMFYDHSTDCNIVCEP